MVFRPKKKVEEANDNENKQNPTNLETNRKPAELLTPRLRTEDEKEKSKEKEENAQQTLQQQQKKVSDENKQNKGSALRRYGKEWMVALGVGLGYTAVVGFAAGFSAFQILVIDLFSIGLGLVFMLAEPDPDKAFDAAVRFDAGVHGFLSLKQEEKKNTDEEQKEKEEQPVSKQPASDQNKQK